MKFVKIYTWHLLIHEGQMQVLNKDIKEDNSLYNSLCNFISFISNKKIIYIHKTNCRMYHVHREKIMNTVSGQRF